MMASKIVLGNIVLTSKGITKYHQSGDLGQY